MSLIELVRKILTEFPKISEVCDTVHIDFSKETPASYGLSPTGDSLVSEDILGNQMRRHNFLLYATYSAVNDYERLANSGTIDELQLWLERYKCAGTAFSIPIGESDKREYTGKLVKITCANGMLYSIPNENNIDGVQYQLQIAVDYTVEFLGG